MSNPKCPACESRTSDGLCLVAAKLLRDAIGETLPCPTSDAACERCAADPDPQDLNRVTASLAVAGAIPIGRALDVAAQYRDVLAVGRILTPENCPPAGVGARVHRFLARLGFQIEAGCNCQDMICDMNREGPDWCEANLEKIVNQMKHEARRRGMLLFSKPLARLIVRRAIARERAS